MNVLTMKFNYSDVLIDFSLTVKGLLKYSYLSVVRLFHLLRKGNQVLKKQ